MLSSGFIKTAQNREDQVIRVKNTLGKRNSITPQPQQVPKGLHAPSKFNKVSCCLTRSWRSQDIEQQELPGEMTKPIGLKHKPHKIIYTDGSSRQITDTGIMTASGVY